MIKYAALFALVVVPALAAQSAPATHPVAKPFASMQFIPLNNGPNTVDLDGDGVLDLVFAARRENGNAHSYTLYTFYAAYADPAEPDARWHLVPFFGARSDLASGAESQHTYEGADCILDHIWVIRDSSKEHAPIRVVVGHRELGESFATAASVRFVIYDLVRSDGGFGYPPLYFRAVRTIVPRKKFCDIGAAAAAVLGVGPGGGDQ